MHKKNASTTCERKTESRQVNGDSLRRVEQRYVGKVKASCTVREGEQQRGEQDRNSMKVRGWERGTRGAKRDREEVQRRRCIATQGENSMQHHGGLMERMETSESSRKALQMTRGYRGKHAVEKLRQFDEKGIDGERNAHYSTMGAGGN